MQYALAVSIRWAVGFYFSPASQFTTTAIGVSGPAASGTANRNLFPFEATSYDVSSGGMSNSRLGTPSRNGSVSLISTPVNIVERADIRMVQSGNSTNLIGKTFAPSLGRNFYRNIATGARV